MYGSKLDVSVILTPLKRGEQKNKQLYVSYTKWITNESSNEGKLFQARNGVYNEIHKILMQNGLDNLFIKRKRKDTAVHLPPFMARVFVLISLRHVKQK